jgi:hypothetical protein
MLLLTKLYNSYKLYIFFLFLGVIFIYNIYNTEKESMRSIGFTHSNCPNLLIKKNNMFYMYNTQKNIIPGVNPIKFENLEDYKEFMEWLRGQGIRCPVLYLENMNDTQGQDTYRILPDPQEPNIGLPPNRPFKETKLFDAGHNKGSMPGFDPMNQYIGNITPLDKMFHDNQLFGTQRKSANPMDLNFGGSQMAEEAVESGAYEQDYIYKV